MSKIPEILTSISGEKIDSVEKWENFRREEIIHLFEEYMYGVRDIERPDDLVFNVKREFYIYGMRVKDIEIGFDDYRFPFKLYLPAKLEKPAPAFIYVQHENLENFIKDIRNKFSGYATSEAYAWPGMSISGTSIMPRCAP